MYFHVHAIKFKHSVWLCPMFTTTNDHEKWSADHRSPFCTYTEDNFLCNLQKGSQKCCMYAFVNIYICLTLLLRTCVSSISMPSEVRRQLKSFLIWWNKIVYRRTKVPLKMYMCIAYMDMDASAVVRERLVLLPNDSTLMCYNARDCLHMSFNYH